MISGLLLIVVKAAHKFLIKKAIYVDHIPP